MANIKKIPALNGIRAFSVILVVAAHCGFGNIIPGGFGVTVFFFLSGFLITTLLTLEAKNTNSINIPHFYIRRCIRLYPAFIIIISIAYLLAYFNIIGGKATVIGAVAQVFYFANYYNIFFEGVKSTPAGTGILWSLSVEEHFYFVYPILFALFVLKINRKSLLILLIFLITFILLWRLYLVNYSDILQNRIFYASDTRVDSIIFGCILALTKNPVDSIGKRKLLKRDMFLIFVSISVIIFTFIYRDETFRLTLRYTLQGLALIPLFYYSIAFSEHILFSFLNYQVLDRIGVYSYTIYLIHYILIEIIEKNLPQISQKYVMLPIVLIASTFISYLIFNIVEKPLNKYRIKYR